jgi:uncharacterized membrane protein YkoI
MKLLIILLSPLLVFASGETLSPSEHRSIHNYNNSPIVKMNKKRNMHKLHKVDEEMAKSIAKKETNEDVENMKLMHQGNILFYRVKTKNHLLKINALDGSIIK